MLRSLAAFLILSLLILFKRSILLSITDLGGRLILTEKFYVDLRVEMYAGLCALFRLALDISTHEGHIACVDPLEIEVVVQVLAVAVLGLWLVLLFLLCVLVDGLV